jgi:aspartate aminotransferase-like enzyme
MDDWGVDVAITGSQKSLMLPPGLAYLGLSNRAWAAIDKNKSRRSFYLDLAKYRKSIEDGDTPFTPANTLIEAQRVSLKMIQEETLEMVWKRTHLIAESFRQARSSALNCSPNTRPGSVTAVVTSSRRHRQGFPQSLKNKHNIHLAGGAR